MASRLAPLRLAALIAAFDQVRVEPARLERRDEVVAELALRQIHVHGVGHETTRTLVKTELSI